MNIRFFLMLIFLSCTTAFGMTDVDRAADVAQAERVLARLSLGTDSKKAKPAEEIEILYTGDAAEAYKILQDWVQNPDQWFKDGNPCDLEDGGDDEGLYQRTLISCLNHIFCKDLNVAPEAVAMMIRALNVDVTKEECKKAIWFNACMSKQIQFYIIKTLVSAGGDFSFCDDEMQETPLHYCIREEKYDLMCVLLEAKVNVNAEDYNGDTPLHLAARIPDTKYCNALVKKRALVHRINKDLDTSLVVAHECEHGDVENVLIRAGANKDDIKTLERVTVDVYDFGAGSFIVEVGTLKGNKLYFIVRGKDTRHRFSELRQSDIKMFGPSKVKYKSSRTLCVDPALTIEKIIKLNKFDALIGRLSAEIYDQKYPACFDEGDDADNEGYEGDEDEGDKEDQPASQHDGTCVAEIAEVPGGDFDLS